MHQCCSEKSKSKQISLKNLVLELPCDTLLSTYADDPVTAVSVVVKAFGHVVRLVAVAVVVPLTVAHY